MVGAVVGAVVGAIVSAAVSAVVSAVVSAGVSAGVAGRAERAAPRRPRGLRAPRGSGPPHAAPGSSPSDAFFLRFV